MPLDPFHTLSAACRMVEADAAIPLTITASINVNGGDGADYSYTVEGTVTATRVTRVADPDTLAANTFALERQVCPPASPTTSIQKRTIAGVAQIPVATGTVTITDIYSGVPTVSTIDVELLFSFSGDTVVLNLPASGGTIATEYIITGVNLKTLEEMVGTFGYSGPGVGLPPGVTSTESVTYVVTAPP